MIFSSLSGNDARIVAYCCHGIQTQMGCAYRRDEHCVDGWLRARPFRNVLNAKFLLTPTEVWKSAATSVAGMLRNAVLHTWDGLTRVEWRPLLTCIAMVSTSQTFCACMKPKVSSILTPGQTCKRSFGCQLSEKSCLACQSYIEIVDQHTYWANKDQSLVLCRNQWTCLHSVSFA